MPRQETLAAVRGYHQAWTSRNYDDVSRYLAPDLRVEVPINAYPSGETFAAAVAKFGAMTKSVDLLAEFANDDDAMLLYDMLVEPIGSMRVAEHFTVADGHITRIRQVHDTAALRAAGFANDETED